MTYKLGQYPCHAFLGNSQYFTLSKGGNLRNEYMCARTQNEKFVQMVSCDGRENEPQMQWEAEKSSKDAKFVRLKNQNLCLIPSGNAASADLIMAECDDTDTFLWEFDYSL